MRDTSFMLSMNELKIGTFFKLNNEPYVVLSTQHVQMGRGGAILRTKVKNLNLKFVWDLVLGVWNF